MNSRFRTATEIQKRRRWASSKSLARCGRGAPQAEMCRALHSTQGGISFRGRPLWARHGSARSALSVQSTMILAVFPAACKPAAASQSLGICDCRYSNSADKKLDSIRRAVKIACLLSPQLLSTKILYADDLKVIRGVSRSLSPHLRQCLAETTKLFGQTSQSFKICGAQRVPWIPLLPSANT